MKLDLQFFGGRGASGTLKNPNGKIAKKKNTIDENTKKLKDSLMAEYGKDTIQTYLDGKMTSIQLADEIGNSGADLVENLKRQMDNALNTINNNNNNAYTGATFKALPKVFQDNIKNQIEWLKSEQEKHIKNGNNYESEWSAGVKGIKEKMKITATHDLNGNITYTIKEGRKIINKNASEENMVNQVSMFYKKKLKEAQSR